MHQQDAQHGALMSMLAKLSGGQEEKEKSGGVEEGAAASDRSGGGLVMSQGADVPTSNHYDTNA